MKSIYETCRALPDTEGLAHLRQPNPDLPVAAPGAAVVGARMAAAQDEILERARRLLERTATGAL